ncbi:MAG: tRNA (adenosine(37)-N6)-threonylcarbamoyltransferase complex dimerization subunit type 1 TsaB [Firmicutes bacterium]|nr:tRNA (adenosine(37)-N6)-threonylcarbamoyltransferase complex dimerization subunit type 1 TsaB [Bacillota bacterium]
MLILGIETATPWGGIGLWEDGENLIEVSIKNPKGGGEYLLSIFDTLIKKVQRDLVEIDLIAVGIGPGSYTGIRVGLAAAKGLAEGLGKPVFGINTLRIIAENARYSNAEWIASLIDARRHEVYAALYQNTPNGLKESVPPHTASVTELADTLGALSPVVICGDGGKAYQPAWSQYPHLKISPREWDRPLAGRLAQIASEQWNPKLHGDPSHLTPRYLRKVEAEIRREEERDGVSCLPNGRGRSGRSSGD